MFSCKVIHSIIEITKFSFQWLLEMIEILEIQNDSRNSIWFLEILEIIFKKFWNFRNQWLLETIEITKSSFQWQLQVSLGSCNLPPTQATSCSPSGLSLSRSPSSANHSLSPTAVFYSIHPFSTLSVLLAFCCCSPRLHFISLCLRSWLPFLLPYPTPSKPLLPSPVFPMFSLLLSLFFILVLLSLNWSWSGLAISHTSSKYMYFSPLPPVLSSLSLFKFQFLSSLLSSSP